MHQEINVMPFTNVKALQYVSNCERENELCKCRNVCECNMFADVVVINLWVSWHSLLCCSESSELG